MPPRNHAGKRGTTGGSCNTTQSDVQEFQRQQKEFLKYENRNEEGRAEQALRLVSFSEALTEASLPRSKAMDDAASLGGTSSTPSRPRVRSWSSQKPRGLKST